MDKELSWSKALEIIKTRRNITQESIAKSLGTSSANLGTKIRNNTLRVDDFFKILELYGCEIRLFDTDTGQDITEYSGAGRSVRKRVGGVVFDTDTSRALSNDFYETNDSKYNDGHARELYKDRSGRYFFAVYSNYPDDKDTIETVSPREAQEFIEKHGREIFKRIEARHVLITTAEGKESD